MSALYKRSLVIFRRDFRLEDHTALNHARASSHEVIPVFIADPRQLGSANRFYGHTSAQFIVECLHDLEQQLERHKGTLYCLAGKAEEVVDALLTHLSIDAVFINKDYTPFSTHRDAAIERVCRAHHCAFHSHADLLLHEPEDILTGKGTPYTVFTAYARAASRLPISSPEPLTRGTFWKGKMPRSFPTFTLAHEGTPQGTLTTLPPLPRRLVHGGRSQSALILQNLARFADYDLTRNVPFLPTTHLSAYIKYGTHSIREIWYAIRQHLGTHHPLLRQLLWRDFFYHIAAHNPHVFGHSYHDQYDALAWDTNKKYFEAWCTGSTGFPLIDAGIRQLLTTGFMHNRVRMVVASFLCKQLHIDWRWGERFFAQHLIDYDPCVNNGNWQWCASTGCDAQPYFRIFNPWLQQKKFDPEADYIKQWIPELRDYPAKRIHSIFKEPCTSYPRPIVIHEQERQEALRRYKQVLSRKTL